MSNFLEGSGLYPPHPLDDTSNDPFARIADKVQNGIPTLGLNYADRINNFLKKQSLSLPSDVRYLGLACGEGLAESILAMKLEIDYPRMTFLDKNFSQTTLAIMDQICPEAGLIEAGIFAFLAEPKQKDFSVVSIFGAEYLLNGPRRIGAFIGALPKILRANSFVCVSPYRGKNIGNVWEDNGFVTIARDDYVATMYFQPNS